MHFNFVAILLAGLSTAGPFVTSVSANALQCLEGVAHYSPIKIPYAPLQNRQTVDNKKASTIDGWRFVPTEVSLAKLDTCAVFRWAWVDDGHVRFHVNIYNVGFQGRRAVTAQVAVYENLNLGPILIFSVDAEYDGTSERCIVVDQKYKDAIITIQMFPI